MLKCSSSHMVLMYLDTTIYTKIQRPPANVLSYTQNCWICFYFSIQRGKKGSDNLLNTSNWAESLSSFLPCIPPSPCIPRSVLPFLLPA